ncbi:RDD family protein [Microbacterium gorillae]|uniref:RDD family protein n=1 Tax=Microbacterium gorillae TaxID=1231063 RepID=UPI000694C257|nr:RDD family protein [Microbacterium gorillae]
MRAKIVAAEWKFTMAEVVAAAVSARVFACLLDAVPPVLVGAAGWGIATLLSPVLGETGAGVLGGLWLVAVLITTWGVYAAQQGSRGTLGMRMNRISLVDGRTGAAIGIDRAAFRLLIWSLLCTVVIGFFTPLFDRTGERRGWHDRLVGARMVSGTSADVRDLIAADHAPGPRRTGVVHTRPDADPPSEPLTFTGLLAPLTADTGAADVPAAPKSAAPKPVAAEPVAAVVPDPVPAAAGEPVAPAPSEPPAIVEATEFRSRRAARESRAQNAAGEPPIVDAAPLAPPPLRRRERRPPATLALELVWDDGTSTVVSERSVIGRSPRPIPGVRTVVVVDDSLSLSKSHFELTPEAGGDVTITDLASTNGVVLSRDGRSRRLPPGVAVALASGDVLEFGSRQARVEVHS